MDNNPVFYDFSKAPISDKKNPEFGKRIALELLSKVKGVDGEYFYERNKAIDQNMRFAQGRQPMQTYLDALGIDGKASYVNLDMDAPDIAAPFIERIVARCMERDERPNVTCVDDESLVERQRRKDEAEFRMRMQQEIQARQQEAGVPLEDGNAFVPENEEDLELWAETEDRIPEEIAFEKKIYDVLMDSAYPIFKRRILNDLINCGYAVARVYLDNNRNIKYRFCDPQAVMYSYFEYDDARDCSMIGERKNIKVSEFRVMYPSIIESKVYDLYRASRQDTDTNIHRWDESYNYAYYRPYDDAVIEIFEFEYVTSDSVAYVHKRDNYGRDIVESKQVTQEMQAGGKGELITKRQVTVYSGCYAIGANQMVSWNLMENMIKPMEALHEAFTSWVIIMPNQNKMVVKSLTGRMIRHIKQMTISLLKLQQLKSQMTPDEIAIDYTGLQDVDLGLGRAMTPFDLVAIRNQTGVTYYKGTDEDGNKVAGTPITAAPMSSMPAKMQVLMEDYNFNLGLLRTDIGTNEVADGQGFNSKLGLGVQNNLTATSNRSTEFIYEAFINLLSGIAKRIAVLMWYNVVNAGQYAKGVSPERVQNRIFDVQISMMPDENDKAYVESITTTALSQKTITYDEAFKVRRIAKINVKLAELYLSKYERKRQEREERMQQQNIQATAEAQQASNQQTHENNMALEQLSGTMKIKSQEVVNMGGKNQQLGAIVTELVKNPMSMAAAGDIGQQLLQAYAANLLGTQQTEIISNQTTQENIAKAKQQQAEQEAAAVQQDQMEAEQQNTQQLQNTQQ